MSIVMLKWKRDVVVKAFRLLTTTLLSLLLPLSFLLLSRLSSASFLFSLTKSPTSQPSSNFFFSIFLYTANPAAVFLYAVVSSISIYSLVLGLTTKITSTDPNRWISFYPHVNMAWLTLFLVQISVGLGLQGTTSNGLMVGSERNVLSRLVFFFGLHEVMLLWYRLIVRPVVDSTLIGGDHRKDDEEEEETLIERVALGLSCGTLWCWKLRDEVEALVGVADTKRALMLMLLPMDDASFGVGTVDFVNWWLYYMVVTVGMVRIVKGSLWFGMILLFEQRNRTSNPRVVSCSIHYNNDDEGVDNKV
ncbi:unnamed protein product [Cochlearia groenlandica]